jgi:hypothetical protein
VVERSIDSATALLNVYDWIGGEIDRTAKPCVLEALNGIWIHRDSN